MLAYATTHGELTVFSPSVSFFVHLRVAARLVAILLDVIAFVFNPAGL